MTPEARLKLVEELLEEIENAHRPADIVAGAFLRVRRYVGAKDRKAISDRLWGILRRKARLRWHLQQLDASLSARWMILADLTLEDRLSLEDVAELCLGGSRALGTLNREDRETLIRLGERSLFHHDMPGWVKGEYPEWIEARFKAVFGDNMMAEVGALRDEAPVDLRVNLLKADKEKAIAALREAGFDPKPTAYSPVGLRLTTRGAFGHVPAFREGLVEVQDEGSQLIALLCGVKPGQAAIDFCAGAGGKTLTLAAMMQNKGRLVACDINAIRSEKSVPRFRRAGVHNVTRHVLSEEGDKWLKRQAGNFDVALVDAPCSGTGTWRRNPDAKWRLTEQDLAELSALQSRLVEKAAKLVRPGGRLVFATCSLLPEEGEERVAAFLSGNPGFRVIALSDIWGETIGGACPIDGPFLKLSPYSTGTDGFFAAIMEKEKAAQ